MDEDPKAEQKVRQPDFVPYQATRPLKFVKDRDGNGWLCDKGVDPRMDLKEQGCWRCEEIAFPDGGR